jgi:hypothetical protein
VTCSVGLLRSDREHAGVHVDGRHLVTGRGKRECDASGAGGNVEHPSTRIGQPGVERQVGAGGAVLDVVASGVGVLVDERDGLHDDLGDGFDGLGSELLDELGGFKRVRVGHEGGSSQIACS